MTRPPFLKRRSRLTPARLIAVSFATAIAVGTLLLSLPVAEAPGQDVTFLEALFTATSAVSVTGLVVNDPGTDFSLFGELVILLLIQLGGLGLLTFGTVFATLRGRRVGFEQRLRAAHESSVADLGAATRILKGIFVFTIASQLFGALIMLPSFVGLEGWARGAYFALFHAVSAFNNAGFALYPDNYISVNDQPVVLLTSAALFILGGLGYLSVLSVLLKGRDPRGHRFGLNTRLVLATTGFLIVLGTLVVLALEWTNPATLGGRDLLDKLTLGFFLGVTPRTAGFNPVDYATLMPATLFLTMLLMLVGGSPGSTAGGLKTTTFAVLLAGALSMVSGRADTSVFRRRIDNDYVLRAGVVAVISLLIVSLGVFLLAVTNPRVPFLNLAFEGFSAFATVGLSMNTTPILDAAGQLVLIALMYLGRIGPLTFAMAFAYRETPNVRYPADRTIIIG